MLALPKPRHRLRIARIYQQLESSNAFERNDFTLPQSLNCIFDRAIELRSAYRTRVRLRVKAAVRRILILLTAPRTQHKVAHRGVGPVVRDIDHNCVARTADRRAI